MNRAQQDALQRLEQQARRLQERARVPMGPSKERGFEEGHRDLERWAASAGSTVDWMRALEPETFWEVERSTKEELKEIARGLTRIGL